MGVLPEARMSVLTLGVRDFSGMVSFYTDVMGFEDRGVAGEVAFFNMGGIVLGLWDEAKLADDAGLSDDRSGTFKGAAIAYNARSENEVDEIFRALTSKGVTVSKAPHKTYWGGYSGYFTDPEGNAWEVAFNPFWPIDSAGHVSVPAREQ